MITNRIKRICKNFELIENYDKAINDMTQLYICHHRLETHTSDGERRLVDLKYKELVALGMYYNRPPEELIFLTRSEHAYIHECGKHISEEGWNRVRAANKVKKHSQGRKFTEEHKSNLSKALIGNDRALGRRWYNNGVISVMRYECPEGFTEGRIKPSEETRKKMSKSQIKRYSLEK